MRARRVARASLPAAIAGGAALLGLRALRPWYLGWGSTAAEQTRAMPLDGDVPAPMLNSTMAISINAAPEDIWPWLVQMGDPPRGGYYSYTWIERWAGMQIENSDRVLEDYQHLAAGDTLDRNGAMAVLAVEPGQSLVLGPPASVDWLRSAWSFGIYPEEGGVTRLVTRVRARWSWRAMLKKTPPLAWPLYLLIEPGAFIMERKMLLEIKRRAEQLAPSRLPAPLLFKQPVAGAGGE